MRPSSDLIAHAAQLSLGNAGERGPQCLLQIYLLLDTGLYPTVGAIVTEVAHRVLELLHQRIEVRILAGQHTQIPYQAREHAGKRRAQSAGPPQVVAEAELVDEAREQVEVAIRKVVTDQFVECGMRCFKKGHDRAFAGEVVRVRLLESRTALDRIVDDVGKGFDRYVIISIAGSIGLVAPVPASLDGANLTENAAKLVPRAKGTYDEVFLAAFLQTSFARGQISSHVGQVTIEKLALFRIERISVPLPPLEAQHRYADCIAAIARHRSAHRAALAELEALFVSLQHRAFRGEL